MARKREDSIRLLHVDEDIVAVHKPSGMLVIPDRQGRGGIIPVLREMLELGPDDELRLVHRLDQPTSGVLLLARNVESQRALARQFEQREVQKRYLALVAAQPATESGVIDLPIGRTGRGSKVRIDHMTGKPAVTEWRVLQRFVGYCLLECRPLTGRTHQVRVHLQAAGMPLAVDPLYGGAEALLLSRIKANYRRSTRKPERPLLDRVSLHAESLTFRHPRTGQQMRIEAPLPKDFEVTLRQLNKYAAIGSTTAKGF